MCANTRKKTEIDKKHGFAFVPNPMVYGPCRPSHLSEFVSNKSVRRTGPCLRFLEIENPNAPQHPTKDTTSGLPKKLTRKKKQERVQKQQESQKRE